jgi:predicted nuclease with RNAse H fold
MSRSSGVWIGADPGGRRCFGLAILAADGSARMWCVSFADEAIEVISQEVTSEIAGVGVDAPLWWSSGWSSGRRADQWLRDEFGLSGGEVQAPNSLRGAALVQGVMFVERMRERLPQVRVTETHPKALLKALGTRTPDAFAKRFGIKASIRGRSEHERDALISAVAAREGFEGRWPNDLSSIRLPCEQDPSSYWLAPVHYFWPDP